MEHVALSLASASSGSVVQHGHTSLVKQQGPFLPVRMLWQRITRTARQPPQFLPSIPTGYEELTSKPLGNSCEPSSTWEGSKAQDDPSTSGQHHHTHALAHAHGFQQQHHMHAHGRQRRRPFRWIRRAVGAACRHVGRGVRAVASRIRPQGPGNNDQTLGERILNVVTCLPFFAVSTAMAHHCRKPLAHLFGRAFFVVGLVASAYHSSSGRTRIVLRLADYWSVAYSSGLLRQLVYSFQTVPTSSKRKAVMPQVLPQLQVTHPSMLHAAISASMLPVQRAVASRLVGVRGPSSALLQVGSAAAALPQAKPAYKSVGSVLGALLQRVLGGAAIAAIPFFPSKVTTLNLVLVELRFAKLMLGSPHELARQWGTHAALSLSAVACFSLEGTTHVGHLPPVLHAAWHALAAGGMLTTAPFLVHLEQLEEAAAQE